MTQFTLIRGDCITEMSKLPDNSVDSVVTDPPYELTSARPGGRSPATQGKVMKGFMGMEWDGSGIAYSVEMWREALRVLKPGGHLLAFSGSRTYHRMTCAIEDAGFDIRDQIMWIYGSGFPKSHNGEWGGTALKPAHEPICMARKPLIGTVATNWATHGTGALNIDASRIAVADAAYARNCSGDRGHDQNRTRSMEFGMTAGSADPLGRWPANIIHDGSDEVVALFPAQAGQQGNVTGDEPSDCHNGVYSGPRNRQAFTARSDAGSAARFFYCAKASRADRHDGIDFPGQKFTHGGHMREVENIGADRGGNHHPTVKPTDLMAYLCRLVTPPGGTVLDPFMGSGSTGKAAIRGGFRFIGIDLGEDYVAIARTRIEHELAQPVQLGMFA